MGCDNFLPPTRSVGKSRVSVFLFQEKPRERERGGKSESERECKFIVSVWHKRSRFSVVNFAFSVLDVVDLHSPVPPLAESLCFDCFEPFQRKRRHRPRTEFSFDNFLYFREHFPLIVGVCVCEAVVDVCVSFLGFFMYTEGFSHFHNFPSFFPPITIETPSKLHSTTSILSLGIVPLHEIHYHSAKRIAKQ